MSVKSKLDLNQIPMENPDVPVIRLAGTLDIYSAQELRKLLDRFYANEKIKTVIALLEDLEYIDSSGIGVFFASGIRFKKRGGGIRLVKPQEMVVAALTVTRAINQMDVFESFEVACEQLP